MKLLILIFMVFSQLALADNAIDKKCAQAVSLVSGLKNSYLNDLYAFKNNNKNKWTAAGKINDVYYLLEPKEIVHYKFSWSIKNLGKENSLLKDGELICEAVADWQLLLNSAINIVYPQAVHKKKQETSAYNIETFAGIYLAKSKFDFYPNNVRVMWHVVQSKIPDSLEHQLINEFKFIPKNLLTVNKIENFDKNNYVELIALHFSNQIYIDQDEQLWLITDEMEHRSLKENLENKNNRINYRWLPWFDKNRPEFSAETPLDVNNYTIVYPIGHKIYDRKNKSFITEPLSIAYIMQSIYTLISPPILNFLDKQQPLFAFLLFKHQHNYQLTRFAIKQDGAIENEHTWILNDPKAIGLPSAKELGFIPFVSE